jgi:hypothetical protein
MTQGKVLEQKSALMPKGRPPGSRTDRPGEVRARARGVAARKVGGMRLPEPTECPAQAVPGNFDRPQAPVGSWTPVHEQPGTGQQQAGLK